MITKIAMTSDFPPFVAIDFETANSSRNSACAIAAVRVEDGKIVAREERLIRPPQNWFQFTYLHGISWNDVESEPSFDKVWNDFRKILRNIKFIAAHNASFDSGVLNACCAHYRLKPPACQFICTVKVARDTWGIYPTKLDCVCRKLKISLKHHNALSDAEACARIVVAAAKEGFTPTQTNPKPKRKKSAV